MKDIYWLFKIILCSAMLVLLVSCATFIPTDNTVGNMSVKEAQKVIVSGMSFEYGGIIKRDVRITNKRLYVTTTNTKSGKTDSYVATFNKLDKISGLSDITGGKSVEISDGISFMVDDPERVANAFYVLQQNLKKQKKEADEFDANFAMLLPDYRKKIASNTALPEEANKYKVQAEGAVRDKEFEDAVDFFADALRIAPWWPVGHFNRALVLGETSDYGEAKREMKYYLQLVPDAPNARAAQDKIYDWERLESK